MAIIERLNAKLDGCWCAFLRTFRVPDAHAPVGTTGARVVFVVESPHISEVQSGKCENCRVPLAGRSGKAITSKFVENGLLSQRRADRPVGELAGEGELNWLGVVNVCELPLQADAYHQLFAAGELNLDAGLPSLQAWGKLMVAFRKIRNYDKKTKGLSARRVDDIEREVMEDFRERLQCAVSDSTLVVALGEVATAACRIAADRERELANGPNDASEPSPGKEHWVRLCPAVTVPHPSRGQWSGKSDPEVRQMLNRVLNTVNGNSSKEDHVA